MLRRVTPYMKKSGNGVLVFEPEYQAVLDRAVLLGYNTPDSTTNIRNNFRVKYLKDTSLWATFEILYMMDQPSGCGEFAKLNYISPSNYELFNSTPANEPDFIANSGFKGNGSSKWFSTGFNLSTDKIVATNTAISFFFKGFDWISDATAETLSAIRVSNNNKQVVMQKTNATTALVRVQTASATTSAISGTDWNKSGLISATTSAATFYLDATSYAIAGVMSGAGFENGDLPLFAFLSLPSTISGYCKSGLKYFGISSNLGTSTPNTNEINLREIMTDTYTP